ncbi:MAG: uroporphyrinogen-III synthase, partial [Holophagales bacterium]|nr:uroporphyrinogen-III synthase [Holophagales bacterium]
MSPRGSGIDLSAAARSRAPARPRVLLTRTAGGNAAWADDLETLGADPVSLPCLRRRTVDDPVRASRLGLALEGAAWLVLTSPRGVEALAELGLGPPASCAVAAVGPATADACRQAFGRCEMMPSEARAEA